MPTKGLTYASFLFVQDLIVLCSNTMGRLADASRGLAYAKASMEQLQVTTLSTDYCIASGGDCDCSCSCNYLVSSKWNVKGSWS